MDSASVRALSCAPAAASSRSLSTARAVLRVLSLLLDRPAGVRADEVAQELGKSVSTAYYLLSSLCEEGFAVHESKGLYRPTRDLETVTAVTAVAEQTGMHAGIARAVDDLFLLTRKRSYLGVVRAGRIEIVAVRGRQGVPRMPGLGSEIRDSAHALAMGKVVLSLLEPRGLSHYVARGLKSFTARTITTAEGLEAQLECVRRDGFAVDREEFDENFCCIAAPIFDERRRFVAALGLSTTPHVFDTDLQRLSAIVIQVAGAQSGPPRSDPPSGPSGDLEAAFQADLRGARPRRAARAPALVKSRSLQVDAKSTSFLRQAAHEPSLTGKATQAALSCCGNERTNEGVTGEKS